MNIFIYGTLTIPEIYETLTNCSPKLQQAVLQDYKRVALNGYEYPALVYKKGSFQDGFLVKEVCSEELEVLINYEGEMYEQQLHTVYQEDKAHSAIVFVLKKEYHHLVQNEDWDVAFFRMNHLQRYIKVCLEENDLRFKEL